MELSFARFPEAFVRLRGRNGSVREYRALLHTGSDCSFVPKVDAYRLGYTEAAYTESLTTPPNLALLVTSHGYAEGAVVRMVEVTVGEFSIRDCEFVAHDIEQVAGYDVVLGLNILKSFNLNIDYEHRRFTLQKVGDENENQAR